MSGAEAQLASFLARFTPEMEALGQTVVERLRRRLPQAEALVYDNYNFLGVGFSANGKSTGVLLSVVLYPRWANLFFFKGALMDDPAGLLAGEGKIIRHVRLEKLADFEHPGVEPLIVQALDLCEPPLDPAHRGELKIESVAAKRLPRRPAR